MPTLGRFNTLGRFTSVDPFVGAWDRYESFDLAGGGEPGFRNHVAGAETMNVTERMQVCAVTYSFFSLLRSHLSPVLLASCLACREALKEGRGLFLRVINAVEFQNPSPHFQESVVAQRAPLHTRQRVWLSQWSVAGNCIGSRSGVGQDSDAVEHVLHHVRQPCC